MPFSVKRRDDHIEEDIHEHLQEFRRCHTYCGIQNEDISNLEECGCQIGVISGTKVLVPADFQVACIFNLENE